MYKTKTAGTEEVYSPLTGTAQKRGSLLNKTMSEHTILMGVLRHMRTTPGAYTCTCMNPASFMQRMKRCVLRVTILVLHEVRCQTWRAVETDLSNNCMYS